MVKVQDISLQKIKDNLQVKKPWDNVIIFALNILIAIPVFIIIHHNTIDFGLYFQVDRVVLFILILVAIQLILRLLI